MSTHIKLEGLPLIVEQEQKSTAATGSKVYW